MNGKKVLNVKIDGMHCGSCVNRITSMLKPLGATSVDIDVANKIGHIWFEDEDILADVFIDAINDAGYEATKRSVVDATMME